MGHTYLLHTLTDTFLTEISVFCWSLDEGTSVGKSNGRLCYHQNALLLSCILSTRTTGVFDFRLELLVIVMTRHDALP